MKNFVQLDKDGYYVGITTADESPLEPGVLLIPGNAIDADVPNIPEGKKAKWNGAWVFEDIDKPIEIPKPEFTEAELREMRIWELKANLAQTDYKILLDYDKPNDEVKKQRQAWRDEIRALGG